MPREDRDFPDLSKGLMAVTHLCISGHRVVFDNEEDYHATHKGTGRMMVCQRAGNVFDVEVEVVPFSQAPAGCGVGSTSSQVMAVAGRRQPLGK